MILQKIKELISVLDMRKDESIERTFKGVAHHFRDVFSELVQGGHGHLVMMKKKACFCFPFLNNTSSSLSFVYVIPLSNCQQNFEVQLNEKNLVYLTSHVRRFSSEPKRGRIVTYSPSCLVFQCFLMLFVLLLTFT